jgi:hypothetical protein
MGWRGELRAAVSRGIRNEQSDQRTSALPTTRRKRFSIDLALDGDAVRGTTDDRLLRVPDQHD